MANEAIKTEQTSGLTQSMTLFLAGAAVGAIAALLLAPQAGKESRRQLSEYGRRTGDTVREWTTAAYDFVMTEKDKDIVERDSGREHERAETSVKPRPHAVAH